MVAVQVLLQDKLLKMAKAEKLPPFPVGGSVMTGDAAAGAE